MELESKLSPEAIGLKVGLEIHQQLATASKLFCGCPIVKTDEFPYSFERRLRPAQSETGKIDPAAIFEFSKAKSNVYAWSPESSCLVEADEEPPHPLNAEAVDTCVMIAGLLGSTVLDEVHVMRKIVIDGSNTSGFQRTAVVALGGSLRAGERRVGVQTITVEEDASRILDETQTSRRFALDRLGVPLVEIALDPVTAEPEEVAGIALHLGRVLRSTGRVARGLGTIRQDLNVSVMGGAVIEVKGVQKLNLLPKVIQYEASRQLGLIRIAEELARRRSRSPRCSHQDVSALMENSGSAVIGRQLKAGGKVVCVVAAGFAGLLGWEPYPGVRLGKELAELARASALGGIIHSDEFRSQGISESEESALRDAAGASKDDAIILVAGERERAGMVVAMMEERLAQAAIGVPAETRAATDAGETRYLRPRPGAQRMYPETDISILSVTLDRMKRLAEVAPEPWDLKVKRFERQYSLSPEMALKLYDSERSVLFVALCARYKIEPSVVGTMVLDLPTRLSREGVDEEKLTDGLLGDVVAAVADGRLAKEAAPDVLKAVAMGEAVDVEAAAAKLGFAPMGAAELARLIEAVLREEEELVRQKGEDAFSPLMGVVMKRARGRVDGALVSKLLRERLGKKE